MKAFLRRHSVWVVLLTLLACIVAVVAATAYSVGDNGWVSNTVFVGTLLIAIAVAPWVVAWEESP